MQDLRKEGIYLKTSLAGCRQELARAEAREADLVHSIEVRQRSKGYCVQEADQRVLRRKEALVGLQDSIARRGEALGHIHPDLANLQEVTPHTLLYFI